MSRSKKEKETVIHTDMNNTGIRTIEGEEAKVLVELFGKKLKDLEKSDDYISIITDKEKPRVTIKCNKGTPYAENKCKEITGWLAKEVVDDVIVTHKNAKDEQNTVRQYLESNAVYFTESTVKDSYLFRMKTRTSKIMKTYMQELHKLLGRQYDKQQSQAEDKMKPRVTVTEAKPSSFLASRDEKRDDTKLKKAEEEKQKFKRSNVQHQNNKSQTLDKVQAGHEATPTEPKPSSSIIPADEKREIIKNKKMEIEDAKFKSSVQQRKIAGDNKKQETELNLETYGNKAEHLPKALLVHVPETESNELLNVTLKNGLILKVYAKDITTLNVSAIVNPANEDLENFGGCALMIAVAAGKEFEDDCKKIMNKIKRINVSENVVSKKGRLPCKCVINAVGPQWVHFGDDKKVQCLEVLQCTISRILETAEREKLISVAIPPISSGIFGVPKELCAQMYVKAITDFDMKKRKFPQEVHIVDISDDILDLTCDAYHAVKQNPQDLEPKLVFSKYKRNRPRKCESEMKSRSELVAEEKLGNRSPENPLRLMKNDKGKCIFEIGPGIRILIYKDDLVNLKGVGILVSAENSSFTGSGALAKSILKQAGSNYKKHHDMIEKDLQVGGRRLEKTSSIALDAGKLNYRFVVHAIVSRFSDQVAPQKSELLDLKLTVLKVLRHANNLITTSNKWQSIAMPLLGAGAINNSKMLELLCLYVFRGIEDYLSHSEVNVLKEIHLVSFNESTNSAFMKVFMDIHAGNFRRSQDSVSLKQSLTAPMRNEEEIRKACAPVAVWNMEPQKRGRQDLKEYFTAVSSKLDDDICIICLTSFNEPVCLKRCNHIFCKECISEFFSQKPVCPICNTVYEKLYGDQPKNGTATVYKEQIPLPGENCKETWVIFYDFPDGKQEEQHPHPGYPYKGTRRIAYLPANKEGTSILHLLERAFKQGLIFTVGSSRTTGHNNVVTWNDIHHKTRTTGGPERFGYPDPDYLLRVREELEAKGITDEEDKEQQ